MQISKEEVAYLRKLVANDEDNPPPANVDRASLYDRLHNTWWRALRYAARDLKSGLSYDNPDFNHLQVQIDFLEGVIDNLAKAVRRM